MRYLIVLGVFGFIISPVETIAQPGSGYGGWGPGPMGWGMMGWFGPIVMIVFMAVIIIAAIFGVRWMMTSAKGGFSCQSEESPLDILKKRYARGGINTGEFEEKKKDLGFKEKE